MEIKGVFFDLCGTLINIKNTKAAWADWLSIFYEINKKNIRAEKYSFLNNNPSVIMDRVDFVTNLIHNKKKSFFF